MMENIRELASEEFVDKLDELFCNLIAKYDDNPILQEIPYAKFFFACLKEYKSYSDLEKARKLLLFFEECKDMDVTEVKNFINGLDERKTGKQLVDYITELDDERKCTLVGKIYKYLIEERDHPGTFFRIQ